MEKVENISYQVAGVALIAGAAWCVTSSFDLFTAASNAPVSEQPTAIQGGVIYGLFAAAMLAGASAIFKADPLIKL